MENRRSTGQRAGLTHARVLAAARELLAADGLHRLTMRALAARLGVAPNALYSHVTNKTALLDELLDDALGNIPVSAQDATSTAAGLHQMMTGTFEALLAHADLVPLYVARQGARGPNAQRLGQVALALLAETGITGDRASEALRVLIVYTIGFAGFAIAPSIDPAGAAALSASELGRNFDHGLCWLLVGILSPDDARTR